MRPSSVAVLDGIILGMGEKLASTPPGPEQADLGLWCTLLGLVRRDLDEAAGMRVSEIEQLMGLLRRGTELVPETLRSRLSASLSRAEAKRGDLQVSALEETLDGLREALIELQSRLEETSGDDARTLLKDTWLFLLAANRRRLSDTVPW